MHIDIQGQGPDLVLIHGWAMHAGIFAPLVRELGGRFRLHLVDLPGHGASPERDRPLDLADGARRIAAATPPAMWIGWSLGGLVALEAALTRPGQVQALGLIASSPRFVVGADWPHGVEHAVFTQFGAGLERDYHRTIERFLALEAHGSDHAQAELRALKAEVFARGEPALPVLRDGLDILDRSDYRARLAGLAMPSLWLAGRRDRLIPHAAMQWGAAHSPRGVYREFSAGHAPFIGHPREIAATIAHFHAEVSVA